MVRCGATVLYECALWCNNNVPSGTTLMNLLTFRIGSDRMYSERRAKIITPGFPKRVVVVKVDTGNSLEPELT